MGKKSRQKKIRRDERAASGRTARATQTLEPVVRGDKNVRVPGSDRKERVVRECQLCGRVEPLLLGHVAPRWAALWTRSEGYVLGSYRSLGVETKTQDYPKHYLFCRDCEQRLGEAENYLSRLTRGTKDDLSRVGASVSLVNGEPNLTGVNRRLLLRGLAGIALKLHLAPHSLYRRWTLSRSEATALSAAILEDDYPDARFAVYAQKLMSRLVPDANPRTSLYLAFTRRHGGVIANLTFAGMAWALFLGPAHRIRAEFDAADMPLIFAEGTPWIINPSEWAADPMVMGGQAFELGQMTDGPPIGSQDSCPCGLDSTFADCCADRWLPGSALRFVLLGS